LLQRNGCEKGMGRCVRLQNDGRKVQLRCNTAIIAPFFAYKSLRHTKDRKVNLFFYRRANFPLAPRNRCNYASRTFSVLYKSDSSIHFPFFSRWSIVLFLPSYLIHSFNSIDSIPRELVNPNFHSIFSSVPPLFLDKMRIRII